MPSSRVITLAAALFFGAAAAAEPPARVVSINLCTDQLALMVAAPGQLVSVSHLAQDPSTSVMAEAARDLIPNRARAEDIFLLDPDLVLAGTFSSAATVDMLDRLGIPVVRLDPAYDIADVADRLRSMGEALGRQAEADTIARAFETDLAALIQPEDRPEAALYFAQSYAAGRNSLSGQIVDLAGFDNIATAFGIDVGGKLALEVLILAEPDALIAGTPRPSHSRAEEILTHPALDALKTRTAGTALTDRDWVCGTPHVLRAIRQITDVRRSLEQKP